MILSVGGGSVFCTSRSGGASAYKVDEAVHAMKSRAENVEPKKPADPRSFLLLKRKDDVYKFGLVDENKARWVRRGVGLPEENLRVHRDATLYERREWKSFNIGGIVEALMSAQQCAELAENWACNGETWRKTIGTFQVMTAVSIANGAVENHPQALSEYPCPMSISKPRYTSMRRLSALSIGTFEAIVECRKWRHTDICRRTQLAIPVKLALFGLSLHSPHSVSR